MCIWQNTSQIFFFPRMQNNVAVHEVTEEVALWWWVTCRARATVAAPARTAGCPPAAGLSIPMITWDLFIPGHFWALLPFSFLSLNNSLRLACHPHGDVLTGGVGKWGWSCLEKALAQTSWIRRRCAISINYACSCFRSYLLAWLHIFLEVCTLCILLLSVM